MSPLLGLILSLLLLLTFTTVDCDVFPECETAESNTFVASPNGCESYIYCDGNESFEGICPNDLMFNVKDSSCDDSANVECAVVGETITPPPTQSSSSSSTTSVAQPTTTSTTTSTSLPITATITVSTTNSIITSTTTLQPGGDVACPQPSQPDEVIYLPNPSSCTEYYMCYNLHPIPMTCPNDLNFNSLTASCDWPQVANCRVVGTSTISPREQCTGQMSGYFAYPSNCHYYYRCTSGLLTVQECPVGFGWDIVRKMCTTAGCSN